MITAAEAAKALLELKKVCVPQKPERPVRAVKKINYSE